MARPLTAQPERVYIVKEHRERHATGRESDTFFGPYATPGAARGMASRIEWEGQRLTGVTITTEILVAETAWSAFPRHAE